MFSFYIHAVLIPSYCLRMIKIDRNLLRCDKLCVKNVTLALVHLMVLLREQPFCGVTYTKCQCSLSTWPKHNAVD
jgi:hypothetical protein